MSTIEDLFHPQAVETIRQEIAQAKYNEVFFLGEIDENRRVKSVRVLARGNEFSVPAISQVVSPGDVVIHNHPSGPLTPSPADVELASSFGISGVASYIVNNDLTEVYVVVEAFELPKRELLDFQQIARLIEPEGVISRQLRQYEHRPQQVDMVREIVEAFNHNRIAIIEAGTGTGKTMAYLLPAIFWAVKNKERVAISTNTINLQEQLIHKDIPLLKQALKEKFKAVLVKGRGNYACLRKVSALEADFQFYAEEEDASTLTTLIKWAHSSQDGSLSDLNFVPPEETWEKVKAETDACLRSKCPHFHQCFVNRARREAASADLLIVNHHLLFADLALRKVLGNYGELSILPAYRKLVLDEAHNIEDVATSYFGGQITRIGLLRLLRKFYHERKKGVRGILLFLKTKLFQNRKELTEEQLESLIKKIDQELIPGKERLAEMGEEVFQGIVSFMESQMDSDKPERQLRITPHIRDLPQWEEEIELPVKELCQELRSYATSLKSLAKKLNHSGKDLKEKLEAQLIELKVLIERLEHAAFLLQSILLEEEEDKVQWMQTQPQGRWRIVRLHSSPLLIADEMVESVYSQFDTVVLTSATLTTGGNFNYINNRIGLDSVSSERRKELMLPSPFNYQEQAIIGIPLDLPDPRHEGYVPEISRLLFKALTITEGKAFILFTSFRMLEGTHQRMAEALKLLGIRPLKQGEDTRHNLIEEFKRDTSSVLFATSSFWEGVDVVGEALECVILVKLPFKVPTDPVLEARMEYIQKQGGNPFTEFSVPQAVIKFKQGFGRLIRTRADRGAVLILDKRIVEKSYGEVFLNSLPPCRLIKGAKEQVIKALTKFFR
ncbi:MAG: helicase C-terminal domain-containing protein [Acidobacteriota bacterium]